MSLNLYQTTENRFLTKCPHKQGALMKHLFFAAFLLIAPIDSQSEIVKQVNADGSITYVNVYKPPQQKQIMPDDPNIGDEIDGLKVYDISTKVVRKSGSYAYVAIKARVKNMTPDQDVQLKVECLDGNGFQLKYMYIDGIVRPGKVGNLTGQMMLKHEMLRQAKEWKVKP